MFGLLFVDIAVIVAYFVVVIAIGIWSSRHIKNQEDFFLGGRRFGKFVQTFAAFGQGTSADTAVGVTTTTYANGASGIWSSLLYLFATPMYWLVAPWMRRLRVLTLGDFFAERYGSIRMGGVYALIGTIGMMAFIALGLSAMTKTIVAITPKPVAEFTQSDREAYQLAYQRAVTQAGMRPQSILSLEQLEQREAMEVLPDAQLTDVQQAQLAVLLNRAPATQINFISETAIIWVVCIIVLVYAVLGGLEAAFLTDTMQGIFILILSVMLIPFGWHELNEQHGSSGILGAMGMVHERLPDSSFVIFGSPLSIDFTWYYIVTLMIMATITVMIQPNVLVSTASAKDEYTARIGFTYGNFLKRICTVFWGYFGLVAIVLYSGHVSNPDLVWGFATRDLLGPLQLGLVGLMIACLMAALMSTVDALMLTSSALLTHNLYAPLLPNRSQDHYVRAGKVFGTLVVLGSAWIALQFDTILQILKFIWEMNVMLAPAFWLGMKWRGANRIGAWTSIVFGSLAFLILPILLPILVPSLRSHPALLETTNPAPITRSYIARDADVDMRQRQILAWEATGGEDNATVERPVELQIGQAFDVEYVLPKKAIYWTQDIKSDADGNPSGRGAMSLELIALNWLGFELSHNSYALNETFRILVRTFLPFLIMIAVSITTPKDPKDLLDRFYAKMRTVVSTNRDEDQRELALSLANVDRHADVLLFPRSNWEFYRPTKTDVFGFLACIAGVGGVVLLMMFLVRFGG